MELRVSAVDDAKRDGSTFATGLRVINLSSDRAEIIESYMIDSGDKIHMIAQQDAEVYPQAEPSAHVFGARCPSSSTRLDRTQSPYW
jgi:hypothetical protein